MSFRNFKKFFLKFYLLLLLFKMLIFKLCNLQWEMLDKKVFAI